MSIRRVVLMVLDGVGVGELPDAGRYGDAGSNTLVHTARAAGGLRVPNLNRLGLGRIIPGAGLEWVPAPAGCYGRMAERSPGKDTMTGHWEMAGLVLDRPFPVYPHGFPEEVIRPFEERIGRRVLGNRPASGTAVIEELGREHLATGRPIVYTSADSVFQIAAHEDVIPVEELYRMCRIARELLVGEHAVGRVIARPFTGTPGAFRRTPRRRDFTLPPPRPTVLDGLAARGLDVVAVGKVADIFAGRGITRALPAAGNAELFGRTLEALSGLRSGLVLTNLVDFDTLYGHRNDAPGFAAALEDFDRRLPALLSALTEADLLFVTADHGCDPTTPSTDHSREYVPLLVYGPGVRAGVDLGTRETFADLGATLGAIFGVEVPAGTPFLADITGGTA
ncbi:MAG: phosphopentomutase [Firmicutes bacterium]|nr:phosphopentomutase [Bacillota bacterium]